MEQINKVTLRKKLAAYKRKPFSFVVLLAVTLSAILTAGVLIFIIAYILINGIPYLKPSMFSLTYTSENVSFMPSIINTIIIVLMSLLMAAPLGIFSAVYLVEYSKRGSKLVKIIGLTTETLSGIPSIVYGLFGMLFFVTYLKWGYSLMAGACTLTIMILPLIMRTTEEALRAVPDSFREGSFGLGAGRLRTVFKIVLPSAIPGILSGIILAVGRVVGETAALVFTAGTVAEIPQNFMSSGRTLSVHMYLLSKEALHTNESYATAVMLLIIVFVLNLLSSFAAKKIEKR